MKWSTVILSYVIAFLIVIIAGLYARDKLSHYPIIDTQERALSDCIEDYGTCRQTIQNAVDGVKQVEFYYNQEPLEIPEEDLPYIEELYNNPLTKEVFVDDEEVIEEPVCLDWIGWGDNMECYKWN